jgi:hypothetical protein
LIKATGLPMLPYNNAFGQGSLTGVYYLWSPMCLLGIVPAYGIGVILSLLISTIILRWILLARSTRASLPSGLTGPAGGTKCSSSGPRLPTTSLAG